MSRDSAIGFQRFMSFCYSCPERKPEIDHFSFEKSIYKQADSLRDPKLLVDPNAVGCFIVHWAGCGKETKLIDVKKIYILHFENLYLARWRHSQKDLEKYPKVNITNSSLQVCDPSSYHWNSSLVPPSFYTNITLN